MGAPAAVGTDPPAGMLGRASPRESPLAAAFSAMMAPSSRARPLLTPLQSLKTPRSHSDFGLQYPNSEQHDAYCGQTVYFKAEGLARKGAAAQEPSPVPAPKRPAWQLASKAAKQAILDHILSVELV